MGFIVGIVIGLAVGIAIIIGFVKLENSRSKLRSDLANTTAAFARMTVEDSRKLLPPEFYPSWVVFSERQKVKNIGFTGVFRLIFRPLVDEFPCFGAVSVSLREKVGEARSSRVDRAREDEKIMKKEGSYGPENFYSGDLVWAKSGRKEPFWPAIVIDPMTQAPKLVFRSCIPDAACVVFFGHSGNENERDYAWVRRGIL